MFSHVHNVNGVLVVHSHPYNAEHSHSQSGFQLIDRLSAFHTLEAEIPFFVSAQDIVYRILEVKPEQSIDHDLCNRIISLRAPPAFSIV